VEEKEKEEEEQEEEEQEEEKKNKKKLFTRKLGLNLSKKTRTLRKVDQKYFQVLKCGAGEGRSSSVGQIV
jgi:hypothetical protein